MRRVSTALAAVVAVVSVAVPAYGEEPAEVGTTSTTVVEPPAATVVPLDCTGQVSYTPIEAGFDATIDVRCGPDQAITMTATIHTDVSGVVPAG